MPLRYSKTLRRIFKDILELQRRGLLTEPGHKFYLHQNRKALRELQRIEDKEDKLKLARLKAAVQLGLNDSAAGRYRELPRLTTGQIALHGGLTEAIAHGGFSANLGYKEYKCPNCGWVYAAIPPTVAEKSPEYLGFHSCFNCSEPTWSFVPAEPGDAPDGCTLPPVVVPGAWK
jgi:rubredoxin